MGLLQIGASVLVSLLIGTLARGAWRTYLLLAASVVAVYWFQPALPLRSFDFWLPSLTLVLVIASWLITGGAGAWRAGPNLAALLVVGGTAALLALSRYVLPDPFLTAATPPQIPAFLVFALSAALAVSLFGILSRRTAWTLSLAILLLIAILVVLKSPGLSLQASILIRTLSNRSVETAAFSDLRWLGISYIAFRLIHTLRDRQMGRLPELSLAEFATYAIFYPALAAGPIDRAERFSRDLRSDFRLTQDETLLAGQRLFLGLFKKFVVADTLALIALNDALAIQVRTAGWAWVLVYAYAFQIYFDFSGYTDIAIGTARLVGIALPENFAAPYLKPNLAQFWNSWHMTLTQWFRSYFFNPFNRWMRGGVRLPAWAMILAAQTATMLLIGLWHGITYNFVLWGLWHGLGLFVQNRWSELVRTRFGGPLQAPGAGTILQIGGILLTFHFVALGWVFFALSEPQLSWMVLRKLFGM